MALCDYLSSFLTEVLPFDFAITDGNHMFIGIMRFIEDSFENFCFFFVFCGKTFCQVLRVTSLIIFGPVELITVFLLIVEKTYGTSTNFFFEVYPLHFHYEARFVQSENTFDSEWGSFWPNGSF